MADYLAMGFDFGMSRIGVAVGQSVTGTANPLTVLSARNGIPDWSQIENLISEWQPAVLVVGLPLNMDGTNSDMSDRARKFARRLAGRFNLPTTTMDERLTTREAKEFTKGDEGLDAIA
ncbi:MAG: Holliday junction resolvase RuvX, partial [Pseudomonadales bacterium]